MLLKRIEGDITQVTSFEVLVCFRRLVILHSRTDSADAGDVVEQCYALLEGILTLQEKLDTISWNLSKAAILQEFCALASTFMDSITWSSKFLERPLYLLFLLTIESSRLLRKFYANDDRSLIASALEIFKAILPHISPIHLSHVKYIALSSLIDIDDLHYRTTCEFLERSRKVVDSTKYASKILGTILGRAQCVIHGQFYRTPASRTRSVATFFTRRS